MRDLTRSKLRFVNRQCGSGTRIFLDQQLADARMNEKGSGCRISYSLISTSVFGF